MMDYADEMSRLNQAYLHLLREVALRDPDSVQSFFGVGKDVASAIATCPAADLHRIANPGILLFAPRVRASQLQSLIESRGTTVEQTRMVAAALMGR